MYSRMEYKNIACTPSMIFQVFTLSRGVQYNGTHPRGHTYNPENVLNFDVVLVSVEAIGISIREAFFLTKSYNRHST